jgi:copper transporter 1
MLLNWHTIDACFLSSAFHIRSSFAFFLSCLAAFLLVVALEFLRRSQRNLDLYFQTRNALFHNEEYALPEETEEKLLPKGTKKEELTLELKGKTTAVMLEQLVRGLIHTVQFAVSYCIMLLFMYSNGEFPFHLVSLWSWYQKTHNNTHQATLSFPFFWDRLWALLSSREIHLFIHEIRRMHLLALKVRYMLIFSVMTMVNKRMYAVN